MTLLKDKTALVTGGTTGIGLAAAQRIAAEGAHVFITGRSQSGIDNAVASIGATATGIRSDVTDLSDLDAMVEVITAYGHGLDVVFANAGGGEFATLADVHTAALPGHLQPQCRRRQYPCAGSVAPRKSPPQSYFSPLTRAAT